MTPEKRQRVRDVLHEIQADCERDVADREGQPLTGRNVAKWLGEMQAQTSALAGVALLLLDATDAEAPDA